MPGKWIKMVLINLCIVAFLGVTMRYKIAFAIPFINQKNILHAHSHFAFSGWITQALMILLIYYLYKQGQSNAFKKYRIILLLNVITAYGMLLSFPFEGYGLFSISFSTLAIFVSYVFAVIFWKDLNKLPTQLNAHLWFKSALIFNVISSIGPFYLAYIMSSHIINQKLYLVSVYYFLHFQYNGWFLFVCMGLFLYKLYMLSGEQRSLNYIFWMFAISCVPSFFLSALWLPMGNSIFALVAISAGVQLAAWVWLIRIIYPHKEKLSTALSKPAKNLLLLSAISMSIKLLLQLGSTYPPLSQYAFGFRPIVIGYIHLVLLGVISISILGYFLFEKFIQTNKSVIIGLIIFVSGVFLNEIFLMLQGVCALASISVSNINIYLLVTALIMFTGIFLVTIKQYGSNLNKAH